MSCGGTCDQDRDYCDTVTSYCQPCSRLCDQALKRSDPETQSDGDRSKAACWRKCHNYMLKKIGLSGGERKMAPTTSSTVQFLTASQDNATPVFRNSVEANGSVHNWSIWIGVVLLLVIALCIVVVLAIVIRKFHCKRKPKKANKEHDEETGTPLVEMSQIDTNDANITGHIQHHQSQIEVTATPAQVTANDAQVSAIPAQVSASYRQQTRNSSKKLQWKANQSVPDNLGKEPISEETGLPQQHSIPAYIVEPNNRHTPDKPQQQQTLADIHSHKDSNTTKQENGQIASSTLGTQTDRFPIQESEFTRGSQNINTVAWGFAGTAAVHNGESCSDNQQTFQKRL